MCGIAGICAYRNDSPPVNGDELLRIREAMARRGPDGEGLWLSEDRRVGLAHRRLAIIDLSDAGLQPMATSDGWLHITYNGEIYNYLALRSELEAKGYVFHTNSDTEVLLHLYADRGREMMHALRGMYAFAIWDEREQELFLVRDPMGIKPLYYADAGGTLRFASTVSSLLEGGAVDTAEDVAGVGGFYLMGYVPAPFTFYRAIRVLPAGTTMRVRRDACEEPVRYFDINEEFRRAEAAPSALSDGEIEECIREALHDSMRHHMVSDVPVGIFLSAGVDSNALAALGAQENRETLHGITLGFLEFRGTIDDETIIAEKSARALGIEHTTDWIQRRDFHGEGDSFFAAMDQATTDGVNTYLVARAAAKNRLKVAISGLGGDELFGGYPSFRDVPRMRRWIPSKPSLGRWTRTMSSPVLRHMTSPKYSGMLEYGSTYAGAYLLRRALYMPWELEGLLGRARAREALESLQLVESLERTVVGLKNERCIVTALELWWYMRNQLLRDSDWAGMAHGVEVRVPFVDVEVIRVLAPIIAGPKPPTKVHLSRAIAHPLAAEVSQRRKTGFSVPVRDWLRDDLSITRNERGLRGWARVIVKRKRGHRILALVTDAYGGHGGIALYNRDLLNAFSSLPSCSAVVAIPRNMPNPPEPMPAKLTFLRGAVGGKRRFLSRVRQLLRDDRHYDLIVCAHINLMPIAWIASRMLRVPLLLVIYGIDAWKPTRSPLANALARRVLWVASISEVTARNFVAWSGLDPRQIAVLPNAIHREWYGPGPRNPTLQAKYGLEGKTVLMTLGRLVSAERYKGFDEVLEVLPELIKVLPNVSYLIGGDGSDRGRLEAKVRKLGLSDRVVFTGNIPEADKADHYRLADVYVMPSRGEGFGFVLLEALACGIPVVASKVDGGREALCDGQLGILVDPADAAELKRAILDALARPRGEVPPGLEHYSFERFEQRVHRLLSQILPESSHSFGRA